MLTRMHCDKFANFINSKTILFQSGLNIVLGQDDKANSIGKSTLLLIIDFCFGGSSYADKNSDVIQNIGDHSIDFTFRFDGRDYHFSRDTSSPKQYWECDTDFNRIGQAKRIEEFTAFLKARYLPEGVSQTFREVVSRFMRINGKNNYNVSKPLKGGDYSDKDSTGITVLEELFGVAASLASIKKEVEDIKQEIKDFKSAKNRQYLFISFSTEKGYKEAKARLEELAVELERMKSKFSDSPEDEPIEFTSEVLELKAQLEFEVRRRGSLKSKLGRLSPKVGDLSMTMDDLDSIKRLFPGVTVKPLEEIAEFQRDLQRNVNEEIERQREEIISSIAELDKIIDSIKESLKRLRVEPKTSRALLEECFSTEKEAGSLRKQIELFEKEKALRQEQKAKRQHLADAESDFLHGMESSLNAKFEEINAGLYSTERLAPKISIPDSSRYEFVTPNDSGTGTMYKSLLVFDLSVLELTPLPVLIHDSLLFSDIWSEPMSNLLKEYKKQTKQVFIAFDGLSLFDEETRTMVVDSSRINLGEGEQSLFGRSWALKETN